MKKYVTYYFLLLASLLMLGAVSCKKEDGNLNNLERYVVLDQPAVRMSVGSETVIRPQFAEGKAPERQYQWTSDNPEVVTVTPNADLSAKLTAKKEGQAEIKFASLDGVVFAVSQVTVTNELAVYRILAIGNSFSEDAVEGYLSDMARAAGIKVVIGNLYIGSATIDQHLENATANANAYSYRKINEKGEKTTTANTSLSAAITDEAWDFISFQQESGLSGQFETYNALPQLVNYVKQKATNPKAKYIFHQTWAYAAGAGIPEFANYDNDQMKMYAAITDAASKAKELVNFDRIVPVGTAIQNGRTSVLGERFTRDGKHLDLNLGRYTAAATWFEAIFGRSVIGNLFKPQALSAFEAEIAKQAAHLAVQKPLMVTDMVDYKGGFGILKTPVFVGFGMEGTYPGWNGFVGETGVNQGAVLADLKDQEGYNTRLSLTVTEAFNGRNTSGERTTTTDLKLPAGVAGNSYYGNAGAEWLGKVIKQSSFKITGLNKDRKYNFCFFGSRAGVGDNRETLYIVKGAGEASAAINTSSNKTRVACVEKVQPRANGEITITVTAGPNNNNGNKFFYLNAMRISAGD